MLAAAGLVVVLGATAPAVGQTNNNNTNNNTNETNNNNNNDNNNANVNTNVNNTAVINTITNVVENVDDPDDVKVFIVEEFVHAPTAAPVTAHAGVGLTG